MKCVHMYLVKSKVLPILMFFFIASYAGIASAERLSRHSRRANSCMEQMVLTSELSGEDAHLENALFARYQRCILRARSAESDAPRLGDKIGRLIVKAVVKSESISLKMTKFWVILGSTIAQGLSDSLSSLKTKISETESALSQQLQEYQVAHTQSELAEVRHELKQLKKKAALLKEKAAKLSQKLNKKVDKAQQKKKVCKGDLVLPCVKPQHTKSSCKLYTINGNVSPRPTYVGLAWAGYEYFVTPRYLWVWGDSFASVRALMQAYSFPKAVGYAAMSRTSTHKICRYLKKHCTNLDYNGAPSCDEVEY